MTYHADTLPQRIGQCFMVGFHGATPTPEIVEMIERWRVGGVILFSRNCVDARQVSRLIAELQAIARGAGHPRPLLIAVDQEHGVVRRLGASTTTFPGAMALGASRDEALTSAVAEATGRELRALGINLNLAPVADVNSTPDNPAIGARSFGDDPALVARLTAAYVLGQRAAGVLSALKHFPGHGAAVVDSHLSLPMLPHTRARLDAVETQPFRVGIAAGAETVLLGHLRVPALTHDDAPASLSPAIVRLLRESLGFRGAILTDCLEMQAIASTVGVEQGAVRAFQAGADLVLISHTCALQRGALELAHAAVASGALAEERIHDAYERMLALKQRLLDWEAPPPPVLAASVSTEEHRRLRDQAYRATTTCIRDDTRLLPLRLTPAARVVVVAQPPARVTRAVDASYQHERLVQAIRQRHPNTSGMCLPPEADEATLAEMERQARTADLIIVATLNARGHAPQADLMRRLLILGRPVIGVAVHDPYDLSAFPALPTALATYDYAEPALDAVAGALFGAFEPQGRLPVSLPCFAPGG